MVNTKNSLLFYIYAADHVSFIKKHYTDAKLHYSNCLL